VVVRRLEGVRPGVYRYRAAEGALELFGAVDDASLGRALSARSLPDVLLIGTGALAKCSRKYKTFAYRLIFLDSGVGLAYAHTVGRALGLAVTEYERVDGHVAAELLGIAPKFEHPVFTFAAGLGSLEAIAGDASGEPVTVVQASLTAEDYRIDLLPRLIAESFGPPDVRSNAVPPPRTLAGPGIASSTPLDAILLKRRAVRNYADASGISGLALREIFGAAAAALAARVAAGSPPCYVRPVLAVARSADWERGIYEIDESGGVRRRADFSPEAMDATVIQRSMGRAPAALFVIANLDAALRDRGIRGYLESAQHAGAAVGAAWLAVANRELGGSAAGGIVTAGLKQACGIDGFHECPLLGFFFGQPATPAAPILSDDDRAPGV
jgi:SagB-type dehydrogenase family enzyme